MGFVSLTRQVCKVRALLVLIGCAVGIAGCQGEVDFTRKPAENVIAHDKAVAPSPVFVVATSDSGPLRRTVEAQLSERLFRLRRNVARGACVERNGRTRCATARVSGDVVRDGPVRLRGTPRGLTLEIPASYSFEVRGRGVARSVSERVSGKVTYLAPFAVEVGADWKPTVRLAGAVGISGEAKVAVLSGSVDLSTPFERKFRRKFRTIARQMQAGFDTDAAVQNVEKTWRHLHYPVALTKDPEVWLRGDPQALRFGGLAIVDEMIEFRFAVVGKVGTFSGKRPVPLLARAMPDLDPEPLSDGASHLVIPVDLPYAELEAGIEQAFRAQGPLTSDVSDRVKGFVVKGVRLFPSGGRLVLAATMTTEVEGSWQDMSGTAYMVATPRFSIDSGKLGLKLASLTAPQATPGLYENGQLVLPEKSMLQAFDQGVAVKLKDRFAAVLGDVNRMLDVPFAKDSRLAGRFDDLRVHSIEARREGLRVHLDLLGALSVYPGVADPAVGLADSQPVSAEQ